MLLAREFIQYLGREIVKRLHPNILETSDFAAGSVFVAQVIEDDLAVEDRLNEEVREILSEYTEYMRREGVSYQEMFRRIKNQLVRDRKVIRASGRDTGDNMKLSRDKINDLSHKIVTGVRKERFFRVKKQPNDLRLELVKPSLKSSHWKKKWTRRQARRSVPKSAISPKAPRNGICSIAATTPRS